VLNCVVRERVVLKCVEIHVNLNLNLLSTPENDVIYFADTCVLSSKCPGGRGKLTFVPGTSPATKSSFAHAENCSITGFGHIAGVIITEL